MPHAWADLTVNARNVLLKANVYQPEDLSGQVVSLLEGRLGRWGPGSSAALNALLLRLGQRPLLEWLPSGYLESADQAVLRRAGALGPRTISNPAFVLMAANGGPKPDPIVLTSAWGKLTPRCKQAMLLLYPGDRGPGEMLRTEVADRMGIMPETLTRLENRSMKILRAEVQEALSVVPARS